MGKRTYSKLNNDKGFTLVELVVVLALMAIILSITIFSGLAWQDYARFNHEEATAEDIFFAAQNQLTELDASGAMEGKIQSALYAEGTTNYDSDYVLATAANHDTVFDNKIIYENGTSEGDTLKYMWDDIWDSFKANKTKQNGTILKLSAVNGDYDKYLAEKSGIAHDGNSLSAGTKLLFDLVSPYISDTSVLNGSIRIEFSPEAGQVFSVCYSDVAKSLTDANTTDRRIQTRKENMVGYYSVNQLYEKLKGKQKVDSPIRLEIRSGEVLELIVHDDSEDTIQNGDMLEFTLYNGDNGSHDSANAVLTFALPYKLSTDYKATNVKDGIEKAIAKPMEVESIANLNYSDQVDLTTVDGYLTFYTGKYAGTTDYKCRFPVWIDSNNDMHVILDAADIQAQSYIFKRSILDEDGTDAAKLRNQTFLNTFSFYRFGLSDDMHYVYAKVVDTDLDEDEGTFSKKLNPKRDGSNPAEYIVHKDNPNENNTIGECIAFSNYTKSSEDQNRRLIEIENARNLYNMRYETDYKSNAMISNEFKLVADIDWHDFVGKSNDTLPNYYLSSYDSAITSGINKNIATQNAPFPGFRCLDKNDKFYQKYAYGVTSDPDDPTATVESYSISNLTISLTANIGYGVYDTVFFDTTRSGYNAIKQKCDDDDDYSGILGKDGPARKGLLPLGLFAENLGTIENVTLDKHIVKGLEVISGESDIIYTCMVGGFAGNNLGSVSKLTLLDSAKDEEGTTNNKTHINGRTDVGGIIGRQSFSVTQNKDVELKDLTNEGNVTGYENVGGIVGRAYVHYVDDTDNATNNSRIKPDSYVSSDARIEFYRDGYEISYDNDSEHQSKSMTGVSVYRAASVTIDGCSNTGKVTGDSMIYNPAYSLDGESASTDTFLHCAFIGGIAGITQDGFIYDDGNEDKAMSAVIRYMGLKYYNEGQSVFVTVKNCKSETLYKKSEIESKKETNYKLGNTGSKDCYVGGLIGYARLTNIVDCNNDNTKDADFSGNEIPFVTGKNYVGGLIGCSDESRIVIGESENDYSAINKNLVIGERYVGGIAGSFGIGDITPKSLNFKEPAENEASQPSTVYSGEQNSGPNKDKIEKITPHKTKRRRFINKLCNKGIVLGVKNDKKLNYITEKYSETDSNAGIRNENVGSGMIGGISGASCDPIEACDNIQSSSTKQYLLSLVGIDTADFDNTETVVQKVDESPFGGTCVGGINGCSLRYGFINRESYDGVNMSNSKINAIVFGQDYVGGGIGIVDIGYSNGFNIYPSKGDSYSSPTDGMLVVGRDVVGGLVAYSTKKFNAKDDGANDNSKNFYNEASIDVPYAVYGRYAVGGVFGITKYNDIQYSNGYKPSDTKTNTNIKVTDADYKVSVNGIAYTGGYIGVCSSSVPVYYADISGVSVNSKYFAGGCVGAIDYNVNDTVNYLSNRNMVTTIRNRVWNGNANDYNIYIHDTSVKADIFGGSVIGLYSIKNVGSLFDSFDDSDQPNGTLYTVANDLVSGSYYMEASEAFNEIVNNDISKAYTSDRLFGQDITNSYTLNMIENTTVFESVNSVESGLFAGGFFGYVPEGTKLTFKNFTNKANLRATGSIGVTSIDEMGKSQDTKDDQYAYLGGVVGRIPRGMTVDTCKNEVKDPTENYTAANATYLGGLTEVNAGKILNCENTKELSYSSGGVGAFAGVNGTNVTSVLYDGSGKNVVISTENQGNNPTYASSNGLIAGCKNSANITSTSGFAGGIAAADGVNTSNTIIRNSAITNCVNVGDITGADTSGIVVNTCGKDILTYNRNYGKSSGTDSAFGIAGGTVGDITKNLEAGGLNEDDGNDPVAPMVSSELKNNFFISGYDTDVTGYNDPLNITNSGSVCFNASSNRTELDGNLYDRNENSAPILFNMNSGDDYNEVGIGYYVMDGANPTSERTVKMKDFNLVFGNGDSITNSVYSFKYNFMYKDSNGETKNTKYVYTSVEQDEKLKTVRIKAPRNLDIFAVNVIFDYDKMAEANNNAEVEVQYCCAYFTDILGRHYINNSSDPENLNYNPNDKTVGFSGYSEVYYKTPATSKDPDDYTLLDFSSNSKYDINLKVESPLVGLDAQSFRLYWMHADSVATTYDYTVALTYLDSEYEEQTVYRYRKLVLPAVTDDNYLFYDDIPTKTKDNKDIKPIRIEISIDTVDKNGNAKTDMPQEWYLGGITWFDNAGKERFVADVDNSYQYDDTSDASYVGALTGYVDGSTYANPDDQEIWQTEIIPIADHWSKQLLVKSVIGGYNLTYARNNVVQNNLMSGTYAPYTHDPNIATTPATDKLNEFDTWFIKEFIDNKNYFGSNKDSLFVDSDSNIP